MVPDSVKRILPRWQDFLATPPPTPSLKDGEASDDKMDESPSLFCVFELIGIETVEI